MTKLDLKGMASALATAHNISETDAEKFLKVVCEVIVDALRHDGQVKIKGLGTFKLIGVPEREMVDVNSGERITVEARNRISFSPDAILRDIINKPFVFFDTVVLNEGVVFDDEADTDNVEDEEDVEDNGLNDSELEEESFNEVSDKEQNEHSTTNAEEDTSNKASETVIEETPIQEVVEEETSVEEPKVEEPSVEEPKVEEPKVEESKTEEPNVEVPVVDEPIADENSSDKEQPTTQTDTPKAVNDALNDARSVMDDIESGNLETEEDDEEDERGFFSRHFWTIFISFVSLIGIGAFVYGLYGNEILSYLGYTDNEDPIEEVVDVKPIETPAIIADSIATDSIVKNDSIKNDSVETPTVKADTTKNEVRDHAYYASLDVRVRTGAYKIVGLDTIVKVQKGQTFRSITKAYLGEGMECYIEVFNGVKSVKPGDSLKIPKLKWKTRRR